ncbi:hypothetical protein [Microcoleus sp. B3-D7]|uniref:hypothetical protein n=1 Tax=Microcoleus sp. B3-D7 TaxID=2818659 RepID=UPI002FD39AE3
MGRFRFELAASSWFFLSWCRGDRIAGAYTILAWRSQVLVDRGFGGLYPFLG